MSLEKDSKILIVDDFSMMRKVVSNIMKELGYSNFVEAEDGVVALDILRNNNDIKLVITDWHMPNLNGLDLLKQIRSDPDLSSLPVIMITAEALQQNIVAAIHAGVDNFIVKPFDAKMMKEKLNKVFN